MMKTIADDISALRNCRRMHLVRRLNGYTHADFARALEMTPDEVIRLELHPENCSPELYNKAAKFFEWELYSGCAEG
ncbi:MAG: hypothetical protein IJF90_12960 [Synergistaceae bacterium]|nr:hypothetical protein [Synergistaceae bacterium]